jgi:hypothetical protein
MGRRKTNEDWLNRLDTHEKAVFISELMTGMSEKVFEIEKIINDSTWELSCEDAIEIWLKMEYNG